MKEQIIAHLTAKDDRFACAFTNQILSESQETDKWYAYFPDFAQLLNHPKSLVRNRALRILAANVQWDDENRFDSVFPAFLAHITDDKPITARQCIQALAQVGQAKPEYTPGFCPPCAAPTCQSTKTPCARFLKRILPRQ